MTISEVFRVVNGSELGMYSSKNLQGIETNRHIVSLRWLVRLPIDQIHPNIDDS